MLHKSMMQRVVHTPLRPLLLSVGISLTALLILVAGVNAQLPTPGPGPDTATQTATPTPAAEPGIPAGSAAISQTVPVTLTLHLTGPTGLMTVEVPLMLSLNIRIDISQTLAASIAITPTLDTTTLITAGAELDEAEVITGTPLTVPDVDTTGADETGTTDETDTGTADEDAGGLTPATPEAVEPEPTAAPTAVPAPVEAAPTATPEPSPTATPEPVVAAPACPDDRAVITAPGVNQTVSGTVEVRGTATHERFLYYKVEYASGSGGDPNASFAFLTDSRVSVVDGVLAVFDSTNLDNGAYTIKLTVVDNTGNFPPPCTVPIFIQN